MSKRGISTEPHSKFGIRAEVGNPLPLGTQEQRVASFIEVINLQFWDFFPSSQPLITPHVFTFSTTNKDRFNKTKRLVEKFQSRTAMAFTRVSFSGPQNQVKDKPKKHASDLRRPNQNGKPKIQTELLFAPTEKAKNYNKKGKGGTDISKHSIHVEIGSPHLVHARIANAESFRDAIRKQQRIPMKWSYPQPSCPDDPYTFTFNSTNKEEYATMKKFVEDYQTEGRPAFFTRVLFKSGNREHVMKEKLKSSVRKLRNEGFYSVATRAKYMERFYIRRVDDLKKCGPIPMFKDSWMKELELYESTVGACWLPIGGGLFFTGEMIISEHDLFINGLDPYCPTHPLFEEITNWKDCPDFPGYLPDKTGYGDWYRKLPISWDFLWEEEVETIAPKDEQVYWPFLDVIDYVEDSSSDTSEDDDDDDDDDEEEEEEEDNSGYSSCDCSEYEFDG